MSYVNDGLRCLAEFDVILISYDEANANENYADLLQKVPWAKRVHGVEGSDAAHKAAARLSETDRFISVDADNIVDENFFDIEIDFDNPKVKGKVLSWSAKNTVNGLEYGNGGLKCWPVEYVLNMKTHEASESDDKLNQIEFCWADDYVQMSNRHCHTHPNGSPLQAFRAGFREGVKMSLDQGEKVPKDEFTKRIWSGNYKRLLIWQSIGADAKNGLWAMYGARLGCHMTNLTDWDYVNVRDFEWINKYFEDEVFPRFDSSTNNMTCVKSGYSWDNNLLEAEILVLGEELRRELGISLAEMDADQSRFFKAVFVNPPRMGALTTELESISGHGNE